MKFDNIDEKPMLDVKDIAIYLGISVSKAYQLANTPGFPAIRIDRLIKIPRKEFMEWIKDYTGKTFELIPR